MMRPLAFYPEGNPAKAGCTPGAPGT